jgi:hypothetical protein
MAAFALARPAAAAPAAGEKVAVVSVAVAAELERDRPAIEEALVRGLEAAGLLVVPPAESRRLTEGRESLVACGAETCLLELARAVGAPSFVHASVTASRRLYAVSLDMVDALDGRRLASESVECRSTDPCPPVAANVGELARELGRKGRKEILLTARAAEPAAAETTRLVATPAPAPPAAPPSPVRRVLPWLTIGAGAGLLAAGGVLFALDGRGTDCAPAPPGDGRKEICSDLRDTRTAAIVTGAAGLALAGGGLLWLLLQPATGTSVGVGPGGVLVAGRF